MEAPRSDFGVVASCRLKLACCLPNFALIVELVDQIKIDRQAFLIEGYVEHLSLDGRLAYLNRDHCFGPVRQAVRSFLCGCLGGALVRP